MTSGTRRGVLVSMVRWGMGVIVAVGLASGAACSSVSSSPGSEIDAGGDAPQGVKYAESSCGACVGVTCAKEISTCNADPTCATYLACLDGCVITGSDGTGDADPACEAACPAPSGSAGTAARAGLTTCRKKSASAKCVQCGAPDAGPACVASPVLTQTCKASNEPTPCSKCQFEKCCDSANKVYNGGPATVFASCWSACPADDLACVTACEKKYPGGVKGFGEFTACTQVNCFATLACPSSSSCPLCWYQKCPCELSNCQTDPGCFHIVQCLASCTTLACSEACPTNMPAASVALFDTFAVCTGQQCTKDCAR